jgi:signal transduction histidine kinase
MRQFSAAMAHEMRTPLAILRGEAEMAMAAPASPEGERERLASQIEEYDRLTRLINQILTLARAEAGELSLTHERVDLSALAAHVVEQVDALAEAKGIALTTAIVPNQIVTGDQGWLERLLLILLDNAIKFTPAGGSVTVGVNTDDAARAVLSVADTGIGIDAAALPHVFEAFYRSDAALARRAEGAGIGLALGKWIADAHGAQLRVDSSPGSGSRFTVTFT